MYIFDKTVLGLIAVVLTFVCYFPDFWLQLKNKISLHGFSYLIWGTANGVVFLGQYIGHAGAGAWVAGATCLLCYILAGLSLARGAIKITKSDWLSLILACAIIPVWSFSANPLGAVILATLIDVIGTYPTTRKSYHKPYSESLLGWSLAWLRSCVALGALENYSALTATYPVSAILLNGSVAFFLIWRRASNRAPKYG